MHVQSGTIKYNYYNYINNRVKFTCFVLLPIGEEAKT